MFLQHSARLAIRRVAISSVNSRSISKSLVRRQQDGLSKSISNQESSKTLKKIEEIRSMEDLIPPGAEAGTIPSDLDQATGLERLEILGKMQGIDIFDLKPLDASRLGYILGTMDDPIIVKSAGEENYAGCTGFPADSHNVIWLTVSRSRPIERCPECGSVYKMQYIGPPDDPHSHDHHGYEEPKTFADFIRPEYRYR
ncbi:Cytochrome c oxidase subunit 4, mitochondrial [Erysiphe neolycopersici]|uniref:Cytochrome c oxidase subunit 4, mitochondrial n=1 Tax=Erysiphe neolycopersici TaxID=212602 RepID=A0A420I1R6_9PEZI|nr:Cytochrome c oxidase subunit 4, mitochondrial [Erysiphe neolycopersici]